MRIFRHPRNVRRIPLIQRIEALEAVNRRLIGELREIRQAMHHMENEISDCISDDDGIEITEYVDGRTGGHAYGIHKANHTRGMNVCTKDDYTRW